MLEYLLAIAFGLSTCVFMIGLAFLALRSIQHRMDDRWKPESSPPAPREGAPATNVAGGNTRNVVGDVYGSGLVMQADRIEVHVMPPPERRTPEDGKPASWPASRE